MGLEDLEYLKKLQDEIKRTFYKFESSNKLSDGLQDLSETESEYDSEDESRK